MHELAVTQSILDIVVTHAQQAGAQRITRINLVIGQLASVLDDSVQFYWDIISADTVAHGAQLQFERISTEFRCLACQHTFKPTPTTFACPQCLSPQVRIHHGEELRVESIEIE